jgi:hypothetical protein
MTLNPGFRLCVTLVPPIARHGQLLIKAACFCQLGSFAPYLGHKGKPSPPPSSRRCGG